MPITSPSQPMRLFFALIAASLSIASLAGKAEATNRASKILTADIAQGALGQAVEPADANKDDDTETGKVWVSNADYQAKPTKPPFRSVHLLIRHANSAAEAKTAFESSKSIYKGITVLGICDACYRTKMPPHLNVLKGPNWLSISCGTFKKPENAGEEKIARAVLPKLP